MEVHVCNVFRKNSKKHHDVYPFIATMTENVFAWTRICRKHEKVKSMGNGVMGDFSPFINFFFIIHFLYYC